MTETIELDITALSAGGDGLGRDPEGRVVFVPFTAPGDRVRVRVTARRKRFLRGAVEELVAPGLARVDPVCPAFGSCGGCSWQHVAYEAQLEAKQTVVADALERIGGLPRPRVSITPSPAPYGYRARTRVLRRDGRVGYRRRRSHALCPVTRCPVLTAPVEEALHALAGDREAGDGEWELAGGDAVVRATRLPGRSPPTRVVLQVGEDRLEVSPGVFFQGNALLLASLAEAVLSSAGQGGCALDLFAGAGFFTLGLARRFERVVAVESQDLAAADCRRNLRNARVANVEVLAQRLEHVTATTLAGVEPDAIVLDPPRTGLPESTSAWLAGRAAPRIVYLSCDPATLARDVASLIPHGYRLSSVQAFDLFPQTPHVEVLAVLQRT